MKAIITKSSIFLILMNLVFIACSKKEDFTEDEIQVITLENGLTFRESSLRNQEVIFKLIDDDGNEITEVTYFVDGEAIEGTTFQSPVEGTFEVYAEFLQDGETVASETKPLHVIIPKQKLVLEDYTGTWCGYCPAVTASLDQLEGLNLPLTVVAIHNGDELTLPFETALREGLNVPFGSPRARINRTITWGTPSPANFPVEEVSDLAGMDSSVGIAINSQVQGNQLIVTVNVASENSIDNHKLVVYVTESSILSDQENYYNNDPNSPYFGLGEVMEGFSQEHVWRASLTNILGDEIPTTPALTEYIENFAFEIPQDFVVENLDLVVMVVNQDNTAINSQHAAVNENKPYE
ncbi:MAG: Omp28-related outer membrane protein [Flavobacteriaceae bacterium]